MADGVTLVIATKNSGKLIEIETLLKNYPISLKSLSDFGPIPQVEEDGLSFDENAYKKAAFTARVLGLTALADDSGLVVPALGGQPGVHSARYGGDGLTDAQRCELLLKNLSGQTDRNACLVHDQSCQNTDRSRTFNYRLSVGCRSNSATPNGIAGNQKRLL